MVSTRLTSYKLGPVVVLVLAPMMLGMHCERIEPPPPVYRMCTQGVLLRFGAVLHGSGDNRHITLDLNRDPRCEVWFERVTFDYPIDKTVFVRTEILPKDLQFRRANGGLAVAVPVKLVKEPVALSHLSIDIKTRPKRNLAGPKDSDEWISTKMKLPVNPPPHPLPAAMP